MYFLKKKKEFVVLQGWMHELFLDPTGRNKIEKSLQR